MSNDEYMKALYAIIERAFSASEKARCEGLLALEEDMDEDKEPGRDIFEYGMRFVVDGTDSSVIDKILSNIVRQEKDEQQLLLKTIQKEALLAVQEGMSTQLLAVLLNSYTDLPFNDPVFKNLLDVYCR